MRIILTHEQADFDALASLLGAWLTDDSAFAILPTRMNRNVRAFLNLYGTELPFIERDDLPNQPIESVTLVDTQSMVSIRGVGPKTPVHVIDHHTRRPNLPENWNIMTEETGAVTTLLVEALSQQNEGLNSTYATLLLLGIYEDTGSLTYTRTTPRDLQAAAFLLSESASLSVAVDFLNHPLSVEQQDIYEKLRRNIQPYTIHGHTVIITCGDAGELDEEISTITHKLRDLLDPDAIFTLVQTKSGVQLIARSNSDHINVAEITSYFGGGGHERAAAALIREKVTEDVCADLEKILPGYIHPAITVAQLMSRDPQLINADTPVEEVSVRMQKYGYEGFPVVQDEKLVGLLNRRAVDRALAHKLHLSASSLMEAGEVTVKPDDSIEYLQRVMTETGWGQIPVIHPKTGVIIGIVTRTDLLKTLSPEPRLPGRLNMGERLEVSVPPAHLTLFKSVAEVANGLHLPLYVVGGFVRDLILERPSLDFDLVVEGDAITLARALVQRYGGRFTSHRRFGTAKWFLHEVEIEYTALDPKSQDQNPEFLDLISARTEFYTHPTALPTVERGSIKLDLHRRDFTINTLALRLDGHHYGDLYDYWGGLDDLHQGQIRVLHSISFVDDPTRMLRAVRFEQRFGFKIEERTLQLLHEALPLMNRVSGDRIRHELDHIIDEDNASHMLARLNDLGLLSTIHPDISWDEWIHEKVSNLRESSTPPPEWDLSGDWDRQPFMRIMVYALWFIRLLPERTRLVVDRLKLARETASDILQACRLWQMLPALAKGSPASSSSTIVAQLDGYPSLALYTAYLATGDQQEKDLLLKYVRCWKNLRPAITGDKLRELGIPPGPIYARILNALRNAWLDGEVSSISQEADLLKQILLEYADKVHSPDNHRLPEDEHTHQPENS